MSLRRAAAGLVLAAALLPAAAPAQATTLVTRWDVTYDVSVELEHHRATAETSRDETLSYRVTGTLPEADFEDKRMQRGISGDVKQTVDGKMSADTKHADGTSYSCGGGPAQANGFVTVQSTGSALGVGPIVALNATCVGTQPDAVGISPSDRTRTTVALPTMDELEGDRWERRFSVVLADETCPVVDLSETIGCTAKWTGTITFKLRKRSEKPDDDDLLAPDVDDLLGTVKTPKKPRLNPAKDQATVTVRCPKACTVEPAIGVFSQCRGKPCVLPVQAKKQRLRANRSTKVTLPLNAKARRVAQQGVVGMRLTVTMGGKQRRAVYALR